MVLQIPFDVHPPLHEAIVHHRIGAEGLIVPVTLPDVVKGAVDALSFPHEHPTIADIRCQ
jgi:hypothetical protein